MSRQKAAQERVKGYVVGAAHGGRSWCVRVKDAETGLNGSKLPVTNVRVGTTLRPGMDVTFQIVPDGLGDITWAGDVAEAPRVEATKPDKDEDDEGESNICLSVMVVRYPKGFYANFTRATSVKAAQEWLEDMGNEDEKVVDVVTIRHHFDDDGEAAIRTLSALVEICDEQPDSICQTLERFLNEVFSAGVRYGKNQIGKNR